MKKTLTFLLALLFFTGIASVGEANPDRNTAKEPTLAQRIWDLVEAMYRSNPHLGEYRPIYWNHRFNRTMDRCIPDSTPVFLPDGQKTIFLNGEGPWQVIDGWLLGLIAEREELKRTQEALTQAHKEVEIFKSRVNILEAEKAVLQQEAAISKRWTAIVALAGIIVAIGTALLLVWRFRSALSKKEAGV